MIDILIAIIITHLIALAIPGPDFFLVIKTSLGYTTKYAFMVVLGISVGVVAHFTFSLFFLKTLETHANTFFHIFRIFGCAYLTYLGVTSLISAVSRLRRKEVNISEESAKSENSLDMSAQLMSKKPSGVYIEESLVGGFVKGLLTNLLNPKVVAYFMGILSMLPGFSTLDETLLAVVAFSFFGITFLWFAGLTRVITFFRQRMRLDKVVGYVEGVAGVLFLGFATRFLLEEV